MLTLDAATLQDKCSLIGVIVSNGFGSVKSAPCQRALTLRRMNELLQHVLFHHGSEAGMPMQMVDDNMLIKAKPVCTTEGAGIHRRGWHFCWNLGQKLPLSGTALMQFKGCSNSGETNDGSDRPSTR